MPKDKIFHKISKHTNKVFILGDNICLFCLFCCISVSIFFVFHYPRFPFVFLVLLTSANTNVWCASATGKEGSFFKVHFIAPPSKLSPGHSKSKGHLFSLAPRWLDHFLNQTWSVTEGLLGTGRHKPLSSVVPSLLTLPLGSILHYLK